MTSSLDSPELPANGSPDNPAAGGLGARHNMRRVGGGGGGVHALVTGSTDQGARLAAGGTYEGMFYKPTVLADVTTGGARQGSAGP